ncbi:MAG: glyoxalase [Rhodobacterales bacterium]|nr:MAG: glyoxalase [Rhodobacterales bacterium]
MIVAIHHIQLAMSQGGEDRARRFYEGSLGLREVQKPEPLRSRGGVWFRGEAVELHLGVETPFVPAKKAHPAFLCADLNALAARLEEAGAPVRWDTSLPGMRRFYTEDPFGNRIELLTPDAG